jgi:hypothetical protein
VLAQTLAGNNRGVIIIVAGGWQRSAGAHRQCVALAYRVADEEIVLVRP